MKVMEMGEVTVEEELDVFKEYIDQHRAQFPRSDQPVSEAQKVEIEEISSTVDSGVAHFIRKRNLRVAIEASRCAADLLLHLDRTNQGLDTLSTLVSLCIQNGDFDEASKILSRTEALSVENGDFDNILVCKVTKIFVAEGFNPGWPDDSQAAEKIKAGLQDCLAYADENRPKFRNLIVVDAVKNDAAYNLGRALQVLRDFRGAISNFMEVEHDERLPLAEVFYNLGICNGSVARDQSTSTEDSQKTFKAAASYYRKSFKVCRDQGNIPLAFRAAYSAAGILYLIEDYLQASETFKEAALLAKDVGRQSLESDFWQQYGDCMLQFGVAKFNSQQYEQGIELLPQALVNLGDIDSTTESELLRCNITHVLAAMYYDCEKWTEAASFFDRCETMFVHDPLKQIQCVRFKTFALYYSNNPEQTLSALRDGVTKYEAQRGKLPNDFAGLLGALGLALKAFGRIDEAITRLKEAFEIWDQTKAYERMEVPEAYMGMYEALILKQEFWQAFQVKERFERIREGYHQEDEILLKWKALQGTGQMLIADSGHASIEHLVTSLQEAKKKGYQQLQISISGNLARTYRKLKNYAAALKTYGEVEELLKGSTGRDYIILKGETAVNQAEVYMQMGIAAKDKNQEHYGKALESYQAVIEYLVHARPHGADDLLAKAYAGQAVVLHNLGNVAEAGHKAEKALELVREDQILIAKLNYYQAHKFWEEGEIDKAIDIARRAAICFADVQMKFKDLDSAWVTFFGNEMKFMFILLQRLYIDKNDCAKALLWAERGRMRLFQFKVGEYENIRHDKVSEKLPGASSCTSNANDDQLVHDAQSTKLHAEIVAADLHHLELTSASTLEQGTCVSAKGFKSYAFESYLNMEGATSVHSGSEPNHVTCASGYEPSYLKGEVSGKAGGPASFLADPCDNVEVCIDDPLWFDKDDNRANNLIFETLELCGDRAVIIEYMYSKEQESLITYILKGGVVRSHETKLQEFFKKKEVTSFKIKQKSLPLLITATLTEIRRKSGDSELPYLQILYKLLLDPISEYIVDSTMIVFVPHDILNSIQFAALHNGQTYLTEEKIVISTPSIRSLHRCFFKQKEYENACKNGAYKDAFVAGNPKPMGLGMPNLDGAAQEAEEVAKLLGVKAFTGENMTKEAVVQGLGSAWLSVLMTHGIVKPDTYPHGVLVLRAPGIESKPSTMATASLLRFEDGDVLSIVRPGAPDFSRGTNLDVVMKEAVEVLTAEEISALPTGIPAGLVVLSACETGKGEVTSEGLLGLGRAVLQAGAAAVVVSHWKVFDLSTKELMTGLFKKMVQENMTVAESLQSTMIDMLRDKRYKPCHWAPFVVLGSPFIRIFK